ncbi:MAG: thioredoxin family protein [Lentisphaeria bacterium]|nr:thioredoxin family protein [Lentisphaeria bacterium]
MKISSKIAASITASVLLVSLTSCNEKETQPAKEVATKTVVETAKPEVKKVVEKPVVKPAVKVVEKAVWMTDFAAATKLAKKQNKPIFIDFSGSDWCHWCVKLDEEVFHKQEFIKYANENLILFMADFPRSKPQTAGIKKQNQELMKKYGVRGFPTIILLNSDAKKVGQLSYQPGGSAKYVKSIKAALAK